MQVEIGKLEDQMERLKSGSGHGAYKASTLTFDINGKKGKTGTGLAHLDRIGRRAHYNKNFECKIDDKEDQDNNNNNDDPSNGNVEMSEKEKIERERLFQRDVSRYVNEIRECEISGKDKDKRNNMIIRSIFIISRYSDVGCEFDISLQIYYVIKINMKQK